MTFFFQAEDGIRGRNVTGVQTCALPIFVAAPVKTLEALYTRPYQCHGSIGPSCAVAQWQDGKLAVWTHSQGVFPLRAELGKALGIPPRDIRCIHAEGAGCYGHNGADDVALDAA